MKFTIDQLQRILAVENSTLQIKMKSLRFFFLCEKTFDLTTLLYSDNTYESHCQAGLVYILQFHIFNKNKSIEVIGSG